MFRVIAAAAPSAALVAAFALPALAETAKQRAERCAAQAGIVAQAVEMRKKRRSEARTKREMLGAVDEALAPSVPLLVGYVFTLNRQDLKADIAEAFEAQCAAFKP